MFEYLVGSKILSIKGAEGGSDLVRIVTDKGTLTMIHYQNCCEYVSVDDVTGSVEDLIGKVVRVAEERESNDVPPYNNNECEQWTLYEIRTDGGDLSIRWYGSSKGYYSVSVSCEWATNDV